MSLPVCEYRQPSMAFTLDGAVGGARCGSMGIAFRAAVDAASSPDQWLALQEAAIQKEAADKKDGQFDIWTSIQSSKKEANSEVPSPYVHPLVRRSASSLSQKSLEICTESLGSETGSEGMLSSDDLDDYFPSWKTDEEELVKRKPEEAVKDDEEEMEEHVEPMPPPPPNRRKKLASVNYHCSISRKSPSRSFPPPLPSLCRRDGPCLSMRRHRRDGRLVLEAVPVPSHNYLHAHREGGRLVLTFIETSFQDVYPENAGPTTEQVAQQEREEETHGVEAVAEEAEVEDGGMVETGVEEDAVDNDVAINDEEDVADEEGEEEVEVVDKGIVVEVKVSRPPLPQSGGLKVQRSSVVINKFVGVPLSNKSPWDVRPSYTVDGDDLRGAKS
ncbi:hypothetical protein Taro_047833 [Colocasia esculenta]|uniref:FAF domain-containing protein n=1 Tax=Colocasia esculenta TaxID=4460 RepID=A0A843X4E4_COLES|nr:hypothetical protein [Colocasia esculenta]